MIMELYEKTGGPAFPTPQSSLAGMTLRDYFAAKIIQAMVSNPEYDCTDLEYATYAYERADAMLEVRKL